MKPILIIVFLFFTSACASSGDGRQAAGGGIESRGSDCILIRTIRDYTLLDDRNLLIYGPAKRAYYVTLVRPAYELRSSIRIGFSSRDDNLCPYGGDGIVVGTFNPETVSIRAISRVTEEEAEQLLVRYGRKEPSEQQAPAPEDVKGAEVEELG